LINIGIYKKWCPVYNVAVKKYKKIPDHAKKAFEGKIFDVYQWDQELFDGSKAVFESLKRSETVTVIPVTEDGKIIFIEEEQPQIPLHLKNIAGKVDPGETPEEAARRELLEETGYEAKELKLWYVENPIYKIDWTVYTYVASGCRNTDIQNLEAGERITPILLSFEEFIEKSTAEDFSNLALKVKVLEAKLDPQKMGSLKKLLID
jgi:ADP-ribose pyrophosphatase